MTEHHCFNLFDGKGLPIEMNNNVTVWADRTHVSDRIHVMFATTLGEFSQVMNVDESFSDSIVCFGKLKTAQGKNDIDKLFQSTRP